MDKANALGEKKISALLWSYSGPAIIGMVVNALYNVVDSIFVGQGVGEVGLVAVTIAFPMMMILMGVGMFVGLGSGALISIRLGQKDKVGAELILGNALSLVIVLVLVTTALSLWFLEPMLVFLGATPDVMPYARDFSTIILAGSVFMHVSFGMNNLIRAQGDPSTALKTMLIAALLNTMLNPLFIFFFHMGIKGSAWATVISQAVATVWVLTYFIKGSGTMQLKRKNLTIRFDIVSEIARIGMAPFLLQVGASLVMIVLNFKLLNYGGVLAVAAYGIVVRVMMLLLMPVMGISQGAQPIIGYNFGAGNYRRVIEVVKLATAAATGFCVLGFLIIQVFDEQIVRLFNGNLELVRLGSAGLRLYLLFLPIIGFQLIGANYFQAVGKAGYAVVFNLLRQIILLIPMVYILSSFFGLTGIWIAGPISDLGASIVTAWFMFKEMKKLALRSHLQIAPEQKGESSVE
ncbi:MAG TPA: MATE family efflux transporter [Negativicutes bacterium]|nr:MATE family efflux transporter [Negativicutes bacterium]